jgi:hypothetical protein
MRPFTVILLVILLGGILFFGYTIFQGKKVAYITNPGSSKSSLNPSGSKQNFKLRVNSKSIWINGKETIMDSSVREIDGRTMVPIKFLLDFLKAENVNYDQNTEEITFDLEILAEDFKKTDPIQTKNTSKTSVIEDTLLTNEKMDKIKSTASISATFFKIKSVESDGFTIILQIELMMDPKTTEDVKKIADTFANDVSYIFDTKHDIKVVAMRKDPEGDSYKTFGSSRFKSSTGKVEFLEEVKK